MTLTLYFVLRFCHGAKQKLLLFTNLVQYGNRACLQFSLLTDQKYFYICFVEGFDRFNVILVPDLFQDQKSQKDKFVGLNVFHVKTCWLDIFWHLCVSVAYQTETFFCHVDNVVVTVFRISALDTVRKNLFGWPLDKHNLLREIELDELALRSFFFRLFLSLVY